MMSWAILNSAIRFAIALLAIYWLVKHPEGMSTVERLGMGLFGGSAILTVPSIMYGEHNPFWRWSAAVFSFGVLLYMIGRTRRQFRHDAANRLGRLDAETYLRSKGKL